MKQVGTVILVLALAAGLYALPNPGAEVCPEGEDWTCIDRFEFDEALQDDELAAIRGDLGDSSSDETGNDEDSVFAIATGELTVTSGSDEWIHDLLTDTQWSYDEVRASADSKFVAITFGSTEYSTAAPRVMQPQPARLQILDVDRGQVVFDKEYPADIDAVEWTSDNRLVISSNNGALTVLARS